MPARFYPTQPVTPLYGTGQPTAVPRLREANQQIIFGPADTEMTIDPRRQYGCHECFVLLRYISGAVGVPWRDGEDRLNDRRVIFILHVELLELVQAITQCRRG